MDPLAQFLSLLAFALSVNLFLPTPFDLFGKKAQEPWDIITGLFVFQIHPDPQLVFWLI